MRPARNPRRSSNVLDLSLGVRPLRSCHTSSAVVRLLTCMRVCRETPSWLISHSLRGTSGIAHSQDVMCKRGSVLLTGTKPAPSSALPTSPLRHYQQLAARENGYPMTPLMLPILPHCFKYGVSINTQSFDIAVGFHHCIAGCHSTSKEPHIRKA